MKRKKRRIKAKEKKNDMRDFEMRWTNKCY